MVTFDFNNLNEGAWFDYGDGRVKVRAFPRKVLDSITDKHTKVEPEFKRINKRGQLQRFDVIKTNDEAMRHDLWDHAIVDWEGFADPKGKAIPCNRANKIKLMEGDPRFYEFVDDCIATLTEDIAAKKVASEKN